MILRCPASPSLRSSINDGTTTVMSDKMMLADTYGMMLSAKMEACSSAPPENRLKRLRKPPDWPATYFRMAARSTPGVVTKMPMR